MSAARILVVDDHATNRKLVTDLLQFEGYEVFQAADAEEAEGMVPAVRPQLILMDIALPGRDGLELTRQLKGDPATAHIRIYALTAFAMKGDEGRARNAGCDGYITKPIDTRELPRMIARLLEPSGPREDRP
jgi:CheY-like chemotaxis protein